MMEREREHQGWQHVYMYISLECFVMKSMIRRPLRCYAEEQSESQDGKGSCSYSMRSALTVICAKHSQDKLHVCFTPIMPPQLSGRPSQCLDQSRSVHVLRRRGWNHAGDLGFSALCAVNFHISALRRGEIQEQDGGLIYRGLYRNHG